MKHIAYTETVIETDGRLADLVLEYAKVLARSGTADTIRIPYRAENGAIEEMTMLVGPASQITAWGDEDDDGLGTAADDAAAELERRIRVSTDSVVPTDGEPPTAGMDDFDDLDPGD